MLRTTERLIPNVVKRKAAEGQRFATIVNADGKQQHLSYHDLDNASSRAAWFIEQNLKGQDKFFYMGSNDIRYVVWVLAAMKTRKCVVFPSPGNSVSANAALFEKVGATTLFHAPEVGEMLSPLLAATKATITPVVTLGYQELLSGEPVEPYSFEGTFDEVRDIRFLGLHTSGTSGHPKPIYYTHLGATGMVAFLDPEVADQSASGQTSLRKLLFGQTIGHFFPLFHFGGIAPMLSNIQCDGSTAVLLYPGTRPAPGNVTTLLRVGNCTAAFLPPAILEPMVDHPPALEALSQLDIVAYSGGAVNPIRGQELAKHIKEFYPILASTETSPIHSRSPGDSSRWNAFNFIDAGQRLEEVAPGFYELVIPRTSLTEKSSAIFHTFPHLQTEYRTSDLFSPIDDKKEWWVYRGRADNWMTLSTGLKMDPTDAENIISSHPDVQGAIIAGAFRFQPCLLIELRQPPSDEAAQAKALDTLWSTIAKANEKAPKAGRIPRELVLFANESKPFLRASKGTIQRVLTIREYADEIDRLYASTEESLLTSGLPSLESIEPESIITLLRAIFSQTLYDADTFLDADDDLFLRGLDSLGISIVLARLKAALRVNGVHDSKIQLIKNQIIYKGPTLRQMAGVISSILSSTGSPDGSDTSSDQILLDQLLGTYEQKLQTIISSNSKNSTGTTPDGQTVVLTGSTGSVGSYILASLLARKDVKKIFCLNRGIDAPTKQVASFRARGLAGLESDDGRVVYLRVTMHEPKLGLSDEDYTTLIREATTIVHNAFTVNFLIRLFAFEPQFQALLNLLQLATNGDNNPSVLFVSSISAGLPVTVQNYVVPQAVLSRDDARNILNQGYAQAKYVCEKLLEIYASRLNNKQVAVLRVGQVCGPVDGIGTWNPTEWTPSLVISSKFLGASPKSLGNLEVNWVPIDKLGKIVTELISATSSQECHAFTVYNILNPKVTPWEDLLPALEKVAPVVVEASEWVNRLEKSDKGHHLINQNPGIKLIDFYKETMLGRPTDISIEMDKLLAMSETMRSLPRVEIEHLQRWMQGWGL
ncbi:hypothetical protein F5B22DRAFT_615931 [Xylaria bambusicola]|uniref:uncharacterized protein n=1 Tax=Xylaria bambusicola TaxID=326684 RepID=UPI0020083653|nr:uncharacterized protein F5B22DRAFT_615931 [Xylaria bambusicola]KAI0509753.1 hypothetical protein F5B22DRAFT_615931 [Xylaria bambusicola]